MSDLGLREQVMVNQFVVAAGCAQDQALQFLQSTHWQFETALSMFLQEPGMPAPSIPGCIHHGPNQTSAPLTIGSTNFVYGDVDDDDEDDDEETNIKHSYRNHHHHLHHLHHDHHQKHHHQYGMHHHCHTSSGNMSAFTSHNNRLHSILTPANTPATPPNFPETLLSFAKLRTSDEMHNDEIEDHDRDASAEHSDISSGNFSNSDI